MQESVQALTDKIYQEGVAKAEVRGEQIIAEAKDKALNIVNQAEAKAEEIIAKAEQKAADLKTKVDAELRLSARQAIGSLKHDITQRLTVKRCVMPNHLQAWHDHHSNAALALMK